MIATVPEPAGPPSEGLVRVAGAQLDARIADAGWNVQRCLDSLARAKELHATHVVYPECSLTGYCFEDLAEARAAALEIDGPELQAVSERCRELGLWAVVGWLERTGDAVANTASLLGPEGPARHYRKTHLPHLGVDKWVQPGCAPLEVFEAGALRLGILICYDASFPEATRTLALRGADLVVLPTNWPREALAKAAWLPNTRAYENVVYFATVNRVGEERSYHFSGRGRICDPTGETMVQAPDDVEALFWADVDPERARTKRITRREDYWLDRIADRRPDLYEL